MRVAQSGATAAALPPRSPCETARAFGVVGFNEIQFFDGKWEIEGRDPRGRTVNMDVDALTGAVLKIDRD